MLFCEFLIHGAVFSPSTSLNSADTNGAILSNNVAEQSVSKNDSMKSPETEGSGSPKQPGGGVSDSVIGKTCHQCRQKIKDIASECKNQRNNKPCLVRICRKCLLNRYGERAEEVVNLADWSCPKCRGICNCSVCMKRKGYQPTGKLSTKAKATGFTSVSDMLLKGAGCLNVSPLKEEVLSPTKSEITSCKRNCAVLPNEITSCKKPKLMKCSSKNKYSDVHGNENVLEQTVNDDAEISLPLGSELTSVAGIDLSAHDIGNALQFLEFCDVFGKVLGLEKGEPQCVLRDLSNGRACRGRFSLTIQFHVHLIVTILNDQGEKCTTLSASSCGKNPWFHALKKCLSTSRSSFTTEELDILEKSEDYETLDASQKLRVLNLLCDEVLGTDKLRNWIGNQNSELADQLKEAKQKVNNFNQKRKDDIAKAVLAKDGKALSASERKAITSASTLGEERSYAEMLEAKEVLSKTTLSKNLTPDAVRIEPIFTGRDGDAYWKLNCSGKSDILHQNVGRREIPTLREQWYAVDDDAGKETIEKYVFSLSSNNT